MDNTPPAISSVSGELATAAAASSTVTGSQTLNFAGADTDSGLRSALLTLTPQGGGAPYTHPFDFSAQCVYDAWNACPLSQTVSGFAVGTAALKDDRYAVNLTVTDAAGNQASDTLGTITTHNAPAEISPPTILLPGQALAGSTLTTQPGAWSAPPEAGNITYTYQWEQCDSQGNNCQPIAGAQNPTYTPTPTDQGDTLRLLLTAANNDGTTLATSAPSSTILTTTNPLATPPTTSTNNAPATNPPGTPGTPNGNPASETAQIRLTTPSSITRPFAHRAIQATGQLLNNLGQPINNATLTILQHLTTSNTTQIITDTQTRPDGTFSIHIPAGPSRLIEIAYRAISTDANYAAHTTIQETVTAGIHLNISPHNTTPEGTITLTGTVQGPIPPQGTIIDLLVYYRGEWQTFRTTRTNTHGHFKLAYKFEDSLGHFPFQAETPTGQTNFPYTHGHSNTITIATS